MLQLDEHGDVREIELAARPKVKRTPTSDVYKVEKIGPFWEVVRIVMTDGIRSRQSVAALPTENEAELLVRELYRKERE